MAKRADGYHDMHMVMQSVSLCDDVKVTLRSDSELRVSTNLRFLPDDDRNIASKAARTFFAELGRKSIGADIEIFKRVPVCAGMGGGSSDGAAVLRALNILTEKPFSRAELENMGSRLGSDIPFCVAGGTSLAQGKGERLSDLPTLPFCRFVIVKPKFSVSTPELFAKLDLVSVKYHPDTQGIVSSIKNGDLKGVGQRLYNVFEDVLPAKPDDIPKIKITLLDCGALGAAMTGTGSAVFGIFDNEHKARSAQETLSSRYKEVFLAEPQGILAV